MKNWLTFYGSCGHTTIEEVHDDEWDEAAEQNYTLMCCDGSARMVYVYPVRFFTCANCADEETFKDEFATLRFFFQSPLRFSHNYGIYELTLEREAQTIQLGRSMLPAFSDEKILKISRMEPRKDCYNVISTESNS